MAENSKIEWTDHTFNPWIGCAKVSPGCANCYAETQDKFRSWTPEGWGKGKPRRRASAAMWKQPLKWDRQAADNATLGEMCAECFCREHQTMQPSGVKLCPNCGSTKREHPHRPRVFCASLADWLDDEVPIEWLADLLALISCTRNLDWLLLTKRPENWEPRLRAVFGLLQTGGGHLEKPLWHWLDRWMPWNGVNRFEPPANVWMGTSVEDQTRADERIPHLLKIPARVRFLSCEPLLGAVDLRLPIRTWDRGDGSKGCSHCCNGDRCDDPSHYDRRRCPFCRGSGDAKVVDWVIAGGESGPKARPMHPEWLRSLRDQCAAAGVAFHFKQWGNWKPWVENCVGSSTLEDPKFSHLPDANAKGYCVLKRMAKEQAGRTLDGREWNEFPKL